MGWWLNYKLNYKKKKLLLQDGVPFMRGRWTLYAWITQGCVPFMRSDVYRLCVENLTVHRKNVEKAGIRNC